MMQSEEKVFEEEEATTSSKEVRSGVCDSVGARESMEDEHIVIDDVVAHLGSQIKVQGQVQGPASYYGVFDGHGGKHAARFAKDNLLNNLVKLIDGNGDDLDGNGVDPSSINGVDLDGNGVDPSSINALNHFVKLRDGKRHDLDGYEDALSSVIWLALRLAFRQTDHDFKRAWLADQTLSSGTTAIAALIIGRKVFVANAGDCRAVLCRKGEALELSNDHKTYWEPERRRIKAAGGFLEDGYLNGHVNMTRAIGDWHLTGLKDEKGGPLISDPEVREHCLTEEDEFMIIASDGLWDQIPSQVAVSFARLKLQEHNDPEKCSRDLVSWTLQTRSSYFHDNVTVVIVCFQKDPPPQIST